MNLKIAAFIIALSAVFAIITTIRFFKRNRLSTRLLLMWVSIWFAIGLFALFPFLLDKLMILSNIRSRPFFITTGAILLLYMIIFHFSSNMSKINRKISTLVQEIAILNHKLEQASKEDKENNK